MTKQKLIDFAAQRLYHLYAKIFFPKDYNLASPDNQQHIDEYNRAKLLVKDILKMNPFDDVYFSFLEACDYLEYKYLCRKQPDFLPSLVMIRGELYNLTHHFLRRRIKEHM